MNKGKEIVDNCNKKRHYHPSMHTYYKPIQTVESIDHADPNSIGKRLLPVIEKAFKRVTASLKDEPFMDDVFSYPSKVCELAFDRAIQTFENMQRNTGQVIKQPDELYSMFLKEHIGEIVHEIVDRAKLTRNIETASGIEKIMLWTGEKGVGKTTLLNHIFLKNRLIFDQENIIWIRYSVFLDQQKRSEEEIKLGFYEKVLRIVKEHYTGVINIDAPAFKRELWADKCDGDATAKRKPLSRQNGAIKLWEKDAKEYAVRVIKYLYTKGWAFVFILDNIDQYEDPDLTPKLVDFAVSLCRRPVRSLVITTARIETINDSIEFFIDQNHLFDKKGYIPNPDPLDLFTKRLSYINGHLCQPQDVYEDSKLGIRVPNGLLADVLIKFFLTPVPDEPEKILIAELANHNIRDMFEMIKTLMLTHISHVTYTPIAFLRQHSKEGHVLRSDDILPKFNKSLRDHLIIWGLMLRDNNIFYCDQVSNTWLQNIYNTENKADSFFLKRLIIDFLIFKKQSKNIISVYEHQLRDVFVTEMQFTDEELTNALDDISNRKATNPLVYYVNSDRKNGSKYSISPRGELYSTYISKLYTYYELIVEDTFLPEKIGFKLIKDRPFDYRNAEQRKEYTRDYFIKKRKQVDSLLEFLECREIDEMGSHNNFNSVKEGFRVKYFPDLRIELEDQAYRIARALEIE